MKNLYWLLDTFTNEKFKGNPTPVCIVKDRLSDLTLHSLAKEFNAPVTAFIEFPATKDIFQIRYFTITGEIPACGHATLGAAFILLNQMNKEQIVFKTIENIQLKARKENDLVFIEYPRFEKIKFDLPEALMRALSIKSIETYFYCSELQSLFIELKDENQVKNVQPDYSQLVKSSNEIKEVVVMSVSQNPSFDFVLRSFCPWIGIDEDPVTGSIHSVLAHYWKERLNKNKLRVYQASERGGQLFVNALEDKVEIGGYSKIIIEGQLKI